MYVAPRVTKMPTSLRDVYGEAWSTRAALGKESDGIMQRSIGLVGDTGLEPVTSCMSSNFRV